MLLLVVHLLFQSPNQLPFFFVCCVVWWNLHVEIEVLFCPFKFAIESDMLYHVMLKSVTFDRKLKRDKRITDEVYHVFGLLSNENILCFTHTFFFFTCGC